MIKEKYTGGYGTFQSVLNSKQYAFKIPLKKRKKKWMETEVNGCQNRNDRPEQCVIYLEKS